MTEKQKTITKNVFLKGIGLHTGKEVRVTFKPADIDAGINFVRVDIPDQPLIKASFKNIVEDAIPRCTSIGYGGVVIHTVEHLMSVLCGLGIDNLMIEIDGEEVPGLDGSGLNFLELLKSAGIKEQDKAREYFKLKNPVWAERKGASVLVVPSDHFRISYLLDYAYPGMCAQYVNYDVDPKTFEREIAPCRTFCLESEAEKLRESGLGKGATYENTLVLTENGVKNNKVRFRDELARHKVLDFIGDIYLIGMPIKAHIYAIKSGHQLNFSLLRKIVEQKPKKQTKEPLTIFNDAETKIDIKGIMNILPHRYPFLLVDKVIEIEKGKRAVSVKNVTINDGFFRGHFPTRPVMPGVLMVEAMAQTAGIALLADETNNGKLALFMATDNVKFRKVVTPGDQLVMEAEITRLRSKTAQAKAVAKVNGEVVTEADLMFSFMESSFLDQ